MQKYGIHKRKGGWTRFSFITKGTDPTVGLVSGPGAGNLTGLGLQIPATGTVDANHRMLFALASVAFDGDEDARVVSYRQILFIGAMLRTSQPDAPSPPQLAEGAVDAPSPPQLAEGEVDVGAKLGIVDPNKYALRELPVTTPNWSFIDGNVVWWLRRVPLNDRIPPFPTLTRGLSTSPWPISPAMLAHADMTPVGRGIPAGREIMGLGELRGMQYPYGSRIPGAPLKFDIQTPCRLICYASVWQPSDVLTSRVKVDAEIDSLCPEDRFSAQWYARYTRIGVELTVETRPKRRTCADEDEHNREEDARDSKGLL